VQVGVVAEVGRQVLVEAGQVRAVDSGGGGVVGRRVERPGPDHVLMIGAKPGIKATYPLPFLTQQLPAEVLHLDP
jgi:hypothetical protein